MKAPPGALQWQSHRPLLLPALALWGWQSDLLVIAIAMGVVLEAPRLIPQRLAIVQADFDRLWSFTSVLFLAVIFYLALARQGLDAVGALTGAPQTADQPDGLHRISGTALTFLRLLPFVIFPFTAAVAWSRTAVLPWSTFSLYEQSQAKRHPLTPRPEWSTRLMHPGYLYIGVTLFAATTATVHPLFFLPLLLTVLLISLWPWRNRRYGVATWAMILPLLAVVSLVAPYSHQATRAAWEAVEQRLLGVGVNPSGNTGNSNQVSRVPVFTAGSSLGLSSTIILRATTVDGSAPGLVREAAFNRYRGFQWDTTHRNFEPLEVAHTPLIGAQVTASQPWMTIIRATAEGDAPLAVPLVASAVHVPSPAIIETGGLGAFRARGALPLVIYDIERGVPDGHDGVPETEDLSLAHLDPGERAAIAQVVQDLGLAGLSVTDAMARLETWFTTVFSYSLRQSMATDQRGPMARFLGETHAGHCEYFATATVLVLRAAGIPARYAVGFSIDERRGEKWIARGRDAHAWCLAWNDGQWRDFDTTPGGWRDAEATNRTWFEGLHDRWSDSWQEFDLWRQAGGRWQLAVFIAGMIVLMWIAWRQLRGSRWRRAQQAGSNLAVLRLGLDSEYFAVLAALDDGKAPVPGSVDRAALGEAQRLHERLRFDPAGLSDSERTRLRVLAGELLAQLRAPLDRL